mgnify:CR=1 FL=1
MLNTIPNLVKIGPVVLEKRMLTHDGRRTSNDDGRQRITICLSRGLLSCIADLVKDNEYLNCKLYLKLKSEIYGGIFLPSLVR